MLVAMFNALCTYRIKCGSGRKDCKLCKKNIIIRRYMPSKMIDGPAKELGTIGDIRIIRNLAEDVIVSNVFLKGRMRQAICKQIV